MRCMVPAGSVATGRRTRAVRRATIIRRTAIPMPMWM